MHVQEVIDDEEAAGIGISKPQRIERFRDVRCCSVDRNDLDDEGSRGPEPEVDVSAKAKG